MIMEIQTVTNMHTQAQIYKNINTKHRNIHKKTSAHKYQHEYTQKYSNTQTQYRETNINTLTNIQNPHKHINVLTHM